MGGAVSARMRPSRSTGRSALVRKEEGVETRSALPLRSRRRSSVCAPERSWACASACAPVRAQSLGELLRDALRGAPRPLVPVPPQKTHPLWRRAIRRLSPAPRPAPGSLFLAQGPAREGVGPHFGGRYPRRYGSRSCPRSFSRSQWCYTHALSVELARVRINMQVAAKNDVTVKILDQLPARATNCACARLL